MQQLQTVNSTVSGTPITQRVGTIIRHSLTSRRGLIAGLAIVAAGLALGWNWLTAIGVAPIILSLAPCAAMCAVGACAMMKGRSAGGDANTIDGAPARQPSSLMSPAEGRHPPRPQSADLSS